MADSSSSSSDSIYDFTVKDIKGNDVSLSEYKGKVLLIVNVASKCNQLIGERLQCWETKTGSCWASFLIPPQPCPS
ncbi:Probable phospholipid hydroperoxide glutathione peroxidase 6, mitochondrial [Linum grandiflorum]